MSRKGEPREPKWGWQEVLKLRGYAERGFSAREAGILMGRSTAGVQMISGRLSISFHGPMGAPKGNQNRRRGEWRKEIARIAAGD